MNRKRLSLNRERILKLQRFEPIVNDIPSPDLEGILGEKLVGKANSPMNLARPTLNHGNVLYTCGCSLTFFGACYTQLATCTCT